MRPRRYQLTKTTAGIAEHGHPWIFRDQLSSAATVFADGDWLRLVDGANRVVAHGIYEGEGAIAVRILRRGPDRPDATWFRGQLAAALVKREPLATRTDGIRLLHGESDGIPAVVIDRFGGAVVIASYSAGADGIARYLARVLVAEPIESEARRVIGSVDSLALRPARRRHQPAPPARMLRGRAPAGLAAGGDAPAGFDAFSDVARFTENGLAFAVDLDGGQKTGAYLDLRGLRHAVATADLRGNRVLNLFSYTGMLGRAAEVAGAAGITQVDASEDAFGFAARQHVTDPAKHTFVTADIFEWLPALDEAQQFDLVIVDPPSMTSKTSQVAGALAAYRKLYRAAARHVRPGGAIVAACCTSRIERAVFHHTVSEALGHRFKKERELPPELDHPVGFPQADYLKIAWWRRTS